jgi:uncharacterized membrane protein
MDTTLIKVEYVISFSDALFAFSITLMALSIGIPHFPENISESELTTKLGQSVIPDIILYVISFLVVGMYWIAYHRIFEYIRRVNITLVWLNLLLLLFISLVAYFTGVLAVYNTYRIVVISYASVLSVAGFTLCIIWWYSTHKRHLVDKDLDSYLVRYYLLRGFVSPIVFISSIGISFLDVQAAQYFWIVNLPAYMIINKIHQPHLPKL